MKIDRAWLTKTTEKQRKIVGNGEFVNDKKYAFELKELA